MVVKKVRIDIDAVTRNAQDNLRSLAESYSNAENTINKTYQKGINNNNTISQKDQTNVNNAVGDFVNHLNQLRDFTNTDYDTANLDKATVDKLNQALADARNAISNATSIYNEQAGTVDLGSNYQAINNFRTTNSTAFNTFSNADEQQFYSNQLSGFKDQLHEVTDDYRSNQRIINSTSQRIDNAFNAGVIKDTKVNEYQANLSTASNGLNSNIDSINGLGDDIASAKATIDKEIGRIKGNIAKGSPATTASGDNARLHALEKQSASLDKLIHSVDRLRENITSSQETLNSSQSRLANIDEDSGMTVTQTPPPNSTNGRGWRNGMYGAGFSIGGVFSTINSGSADRSAIYNNISGIMNNEYQNGNHVRKIDNQITDTLLNITNGNGTHFTGQEMSELAGAYAGSTGKTSNYATVADAYSRFARYTGVGISGTAQLEKALGNSGVTDTGIANSVQGEINKSHMAGRAVDQVSALTAIYQNASQYGLSNSGANRISALQGDMAKYGSTMQGQNFANAYTSLTNGMTDFNNNVARLAFGGGNAEYSGRDGQAKLLRDMQRAKNGDPAMLNKAIGNVLKSSGGDTLLASATISQMTGVTVDQASDFIKEYQHGGLQKSTLNKAFKHNRNYAEENNNAYNKSGQRTIDNIHQQANRGEIHLSESNDGVRGMFGNIGRMLPANLIGLINGVGSGLLYHALFKSIYGRSAIGKITPHLFKGKLGEIGKGAKGIFSRFKGKLGSLSTNILDKFSDVSTSDILSSTTNILGKVAPIATGLTGALAFAKWAVPKAEAESKETRKRNNANRKRKHDTLYDKDTPHNTFSFSQIRKNSEKLTESKHTAEKAKKKDKKRKRKHEQHREHRIYKDNQELLRNYIAMLDKADKEIAKAKGGSSDSSDSNNGSISGLSGKGKDLLRNMAKKVSEKTGIDPSIIYAQLALESADGTSKLATTENNFAGMKFANQAGATQGSAPSDGSGGYYAKFNSPDDFANAYADLLNSRYSGLKGIKDPVQAANYLKSKGYFTASAQQYAGLMESKMKDYHANGGIFTTATLLNNQDVVGEAGTEAVLPLSNTLSNQKMASDIASLYGMTTKRDSVFEPQYNVDVTVTGSGTPTNNTADNYDDLLDFYANQITD